jgi:hypothetical protein
MASIINLDNTTPAPPAGLTNVEWQGDSSTPRNVSAYVPNMAGDTGSGGSAGAVPAPAAGAAAAGKFLKADGTWSVPPGTSPLTTKGDLYTYGTANARLAVGTNGQVLTARSTATDGVDWETLPTATTSQPGMVQPDGTTITISGGVISAVGGGGGGVGVENDVTSSRALGTIYRNTSGQMLFVTVTVVASATGTLLGFTGASSPPTNALAQTSSVSGYARCVTFCVPGGYYYKATTDTGGSILTWTEWTGSGGGGGAITRIAQQVLGSAASSVTFSSIPGSYTNLILTILGASSSGSYANDQITYQANGDTGANYDYCFSLCNTGSLTGGGGSGAAGTSGNLCYLPGTGGPSGNAGISTTKFVGYAQTTFRKQATSTGGWYNPSNALWTINTWNQWRSTAAITSLVLALGSGANFLAGSTFTLYGEL